MFINWRHGVLRREGEADQRGQFPGFGLFPGSSSSGSNRDHFLRANKAGSIRQRCGKSCKFRRLASPGDPDNLMGEFSGGSIAADSCRE